jgi:hypothetical protein
MILGPEGYSNSTLKSIGAIVQGKKKCRDPALDTLHVECRESKDKATIPPGNCSQVVGGEQVLR